MNPKPSQRRLGRGLSSLISADLNRHGVSPPPEQVPIRGVEKAETVARPPEKPLEANSVSHKLMNIQVGSIRANPAQPRRSFDSERLSELANSIRLQGHLQPIVVRASEVGYELVAGERRLRATQLAGITEIPAIVRSVSDDKLLELALVENIHRSDLNPIERARAYQAMADRYHLTHEQVAERLGEDRVTISNYIRILSLGETVACMVVEGALSAGHAKVLVSIRDQAYREDLARRIVSQGWSVRRLEEVIRASGDPKSEKAEKPAKRPAVVDMEDRMRASLGVRVSIQEGRRRNTGKVVLEYQSLDDFERILSRLGVEAEGV